MNQVDFGTIMTEFPVLSICLIELTPFRASRKKCSYSSYDSLRMNAELKGTRNLLADHTTVED